MDDTQRAALALLRAGMATMAECAELAGVHRSTVHHWCRAAGIDPRETRRAYLIRHWMKEQKRGGTIRRRPSKAELRAIATRAAKDWTDGPP